MIQMIKALRVLREPFQDVPKVHCVKTRKKKHNRKYGAAVRHFEVLRLFFFDYPYCAMGRVSRKV